MVRAGRKRAYIEPLHTRWIDTGKLQHAVTLDVVTAAVNQKSELIRQAMHDRDESKAASLDAEGG